MEIERQFLVDIIPALPDTFDSILQGYVSLFPEIRIRSVRPSEGPEKFYLTVKRGEGLVRDEWETEISSREFSHLVECLEKGTWFIEKRRYRLPLSDGHVAEYHRHSGHLKGFDYVEVEFSSEEEARAFEPPYWFGREVTEDPRFSYGKLAREDGTHLAKLILARPPKPWTPDDFETIGLTGFSELSRPLGPAAQMASTVADEQAEPSALSASVGVSDQPEQSDHLDQSDGMDPLTENSAQPEQSTHSDAQETQETPATSDASDAEKAERTEDGETTR